MLENIPAVFGEWYAQDEGPNHGREKKEQPFKHSFTLCDHLKLPVHIPQMYSFELWEGNLSA